MQHIGEIVGSHAKISLGREIIALLNRIDKNVDQRVHHETAEK
jgi:hypothetical protein